MNSTFKFKLLQALNKKNRNKGFTLIELLVVVIIIGVLAAIALPNLLGQVAKGRQAEARTHLASINRAQQAHRLETGSFGTFSTDAAQNQLPVSIAAPQYYLFEEGIAPLQEEAGTNAVAIDDYQDDIRDYSAAVAQTNAGVFSAAICETDNPADTLAQATVTNGTAECADGSTQIR
ncbi:type IV pilin-like G/H family protein [Microcystis sp. T1-4]|uniref:type IV pilin-like G/H family protein n=1 Tax=Microcystis sp. T1-4 TaxID=1160279 RepID=UPI000261F5DA|nr:type IV pilin-like G/H family protein [Microcystis sp. T1-4]CCI31821.1 Pilin polypeptide [Microcystis sp. T1-4]